MEYIDALQGIQGIALEIAKRDPDYREDMQSLGVASQSIRRQMPRRLVKENGIRCPDCGALVCDSDPGVQNRALYCAKCGQAFCWCSIE